MVPCHSWLQRKIIDSTTAGYALKKFSERVIQHVLNEKTQNLEVP
jgi:hypothetical protein